MTFESTAAAGFGARRTITAFFDNRSDADEAVARLISAGLSRDDVRLVAGQQSATTTRSSSSAQEGGFWDSLKDLFMPEEDRYTYAEGLRRGGYLVTVSATDRNYDTALDILDDEGTIDIDERASSWRSEGWTGYQAGATSVGSATLAGRSGYAGTERGTGAEEVIPIAEEELLVGKRDVSHGRVRVRSYVVETPVSEEVSLREEHVHIERRPADRALTGDEKLFQDRTIDLEERAEEAVVAKKARVREELVIDKRVGQHTETISDTVRRTEVDIDDDRDTGSATRSDRIR